MVTENMQAEIADLEAELEEACRGPLDFEEKGRYSWPVALKVARRLLEIVRCTAPLAATGEAVGAMPVDWMLLHWMERDWLVYKHATFTDWDGMEDWHEIQAENPCDEEGVDRWRGDTALAALRAAEEGADCTLRGVPSSQLGGRDDE